jgi:hypothetical protein
LLILAPIVVGAGAALWGGNAAIGRRAARLASVTAALSIYLYGVLAVAVVGAAGHDPSDGWTPAQVVDDNLSNQAVFYLMALPLMAATIGWAAAAATARLSPARMPTTTMGLASAPTGAPLATRPESLRVSEEHLARPRRHRTWYVLLLCAALTAAAILVFLTFLSTHGG